MDGVILEHKFCIRLVNTRMDDKNSWIDVNLVGEECNSMAIYLAQHNARTWDIIVLIESPYGKLEGFWYNDMRLGPVSPHLQTIRESDFQAME